MYFSDGTRVGAFCLFALSNPSTTSTLHCPILLLLVYHRCFFNTCMRVFKEIRSGVFFLACSWLALVAGVGGYVLAGVEIGGLSCVFLYFCGC